MKYGSRGVRFGLLGNNAGWSKRLRWHCFQKLVSKADQWQKEGKARQSVDVETEQAWKSLHELKRVEMCWKYKTCNLLWCLHKQLPTWHSDSLCPQWWRIGHESVVAWFVCPINIPRLQGIHTYNHIYIYTPRTLMTSIFWRSAPKTRTSPIKTRVIWVLGINIHRYIYIYK